MTDIGCDKERPTWWDENEELRRQMDLPGYEPPRFIDDVYTYNLVADFEKSYDCTIQFIGKNVRHEDDWEIRIDGKPVIEVGRHRDQDGNTVYELTSTEFRNTLESTLNKNVER